MAKSMKEKILDILQEDARTPYKTIAVMLGADEENVAQAVAEMEKDGIIVKYTTLVDTTKLSRAPVEAYIELRVNPSHSHGFEGIAQELGQFEEVKSLFLMSGGYDFSVIVEGETLQEVALFVSEKLSTLDRIVTTATHFILKRYKSGGVWIQGDKSAERLKVHA